MESSPAVEVGDVLKLDWTRENGICQRVIAEVLHITYSKKLKFGSHYKYQLRLKDQEEIIKTRLLNLNWKLKSKANHVCDDDNLSKKQKMEKTVKSSIKQSDLRYIVAPMVGGSELAFRLLCRKYGATLAYTPMMNSEKFATDAAYRASEFQTSKYDRPLVAHFSANNPISFLAAAKLIEGECDAIDLNLGCPQRIAFSGHFGSYLLDPVDRPLVLSMVKTLAANLSIPVFVKIRLLDTVEDSIELCHQLVDAGAALIAIHARYRVNLVGRSGPGARDGAAHLDQVRAIRAAIPSAVHIIANGNVITWEDVQRNLSDTATEGIMSAEGLLDNPALFNAGIKVNKFQLALEYLSNVMQYPVKLKSVIFHIRRMCREELIRYQLMEDCVAATSIEIVRDIIIQGKRFEERGDYEFDPLKAKRAKEALERRKYEEGKRKAYEDRMVRKAKREGRALDYYLQLGSDPPSEEVITELKQRAPEEAFAQWKQQYVQHCYAYHIQPGGCPRERTCSFLHADSRIAEAVAYG